MGVISGGAVLLSELLIDGIVMIFPLVAGELTGTGFPVPVFYPNLILYLTVILTSAGTVRFAEAYWLVKPLPYLPAGGSARG